MDYQQSRKWLIDNRYTAYELGKHVDVSLQGLQDYLTGKRKPQRKTLDKIQDFIDTKTANNNQLKAENYTDLKEPANSYLKEITNRDLLLAFNAIGEALLSNGKAVASLLIKTYDNTNELLNQGNKNQIKEIQDLVFEINERLKNQNS